MRCALLVALLAMAVVVPWTAAAQPAAPVMPDVPARVAVTVTVIRASSEQAPIDPRLAAILPTLMRTPFRGFDWVREQTMRLADGQSGDLSLDGGRVLRLRLVGHDRGQARIEATYQRPGHPPAVTDLTVHRDRAFLYALRGDVPGTGLLLRIDIRY